MAIKTKKKKAKAKTPKAVKEDGIYLEQAKSGKAKGDYYINLYRNGRETIRTSETYHNKKDAKKAFKSAHDIMALYYIMVHENLFHDNTGNAK